MNKTHAINHIPSLITESVCVTTTTIDEIIKDYNISKIDILHTDTEGHDYDILMSYSFCVKPKQIMFEHIDGCFQVGEKYNILKTKLNELGYKNIFKDTEDSVFEL